MLSNLFISTLLDWFIKFPALWAATGFIVGGIAVAIAAVLVFRRYGTELSNASDKLLKYAEQQLRMMERTLQMQKEHYDAELGECKRERQEYKDTLATSHSRTRRTP
jgi:gas vesicle protein